MNKKKKIICISTILLVIIGIIGILIFRKAFQEHELTSNDSNVQNNQNIKYNKNENFLKELETDYLIFNNIECSYNGNVSLISYTIENKSNQTIHLMKYELLVKNENSEILTSIEPNLDLNIDAKSNFSITNEVNIDLTNAYSMEVINIEIGDEHVQ